MNRMSRLLLPVAVTLCCALLSACGGDSPADAPTTSRSTPASVALTPVSTTSAAPAPATSHRGDKVSLRAYSIYPRVALWHSDARGRFNSAGKRTLKKRIATKQNGKLYRSLTNYVVKVRDGQDRIVVTDISGNQDAWVQCQVFVDGKLARTATGVGLSATARC